LKPDKEKWERRYAAQNPEIENGEGSTPDPFLVECRGLLTGGRALDLACGRGGAALYAARLGYSVDALDISLEALRALKARAAREALSVEVAVVDLDYFPMPVERYNLIMVFHFFSRAIAPAISAALRKGGILIYCTYNFRHRSVRPEFNPKFLVPPGGLSPMFPDLEWVVNQPEFGPDLNLSRLVARKPRRTGPPQRSMNSGLCNAQPS
jgi:tellurite methyltransferase